MEFTLLGAAAVAIASLGLGLRWDAVRANAADCVREHWDRAIMAAVAGVFAGRVVAMALDGVNPLSRDVLIVRAGVNTVAATVTAIAVVAWAGRRRLAVALDGLAAATLFGLAGWHAGCVVRDACLGTTTDLPWGLASSSGGPGRHPVEIYAAIALLGGAFLVSWLRTRGVLTRFAAASSALAVAGGVRLVTEPLRLSLDGGPVGWYFAAVVLGVAGVVVARARVSPAASGEAAG
jgi:prolipoprotein diacylglyceryltransferase